MIVNDIHLAMARLAVNRNAFWSEADFQFALAWELQKIHPSATIHLERCYQHPSLQKNYHIDIWVEDQGQIFPIELKYKTKDATIPQNNGSQISLKNHGAVDLGCYDYLKDIARIEDVARLEKPSFAKGFAIMLTNEHKYYTHVKVRSAYDNFKIYPGAIRAGWLRWGKTSKGTLFAATKDRDDFPLKKSYTMNWTDYNNCNDGFKYLINEI